VDRIAVPKPKLDVRDLQLVLAVAASGSTVSAASNLHITQSAVSRGLLQAEDKLGARLFERGARGLTPTSAGERLLAGAAPLLAQLFELEQLVSEPVRTLELRVVCECYTAYRWLPSTLAGLREELSRARNAPALRGGASLDVTIAFEHSGAPVDALLNGDVDVALLTTSRIRPPLHELPLFADEIVFVVAANHPLARQSGLSLADLTQHPLITSSQTPDPERRWFFGQVFGRKQPRLQSLRFPLTEAIVDAARAGMGIAVLSEWIAGPYLQAGDLVAKRLKKRVLRRPWRIAFRREAAAGAQRLAAALEHAAPRVRPA
jgi:LysR family transcriptional regulator for metE and metH